LCLDSAASFIREDKLELAQKVLEDGLRLVKGQPDETYVRARLLAQFGLLFKKQGRLEEAKNKLNDSIKMLDSYTGRRHRSYGDSLAALAEVYAEGGDYEKAYRTINDAISAVKDDPWISWRVGDYQRMRAEIKKRQQSRP
ncbi:MAG: hypothetical protein K8F91_05790, partial [Candidatus Obscuribacterales bacterium]|nr:hypothetical protein [Candidatus Obscuribacterales bacterium]